MFVEITGKKVRMEKNPAKSLDVGWARYSHGKFTRATGWRPAISLHEGLRRYLQELFSI
jgi:nucleoside-diphosphate-sugar epimerase